MDKVKEFHHRQRNYYPKVSWELKVADPLAVARKKKH